MIETRCRQCSTLLFKESIRDGSIEIKCPRCNTFNIIDRIVINNYPIDSGKKPVYNDYNP